MRLTRNTMPKAGDCIAQMQQWPHQSLDLIFADPPYNIGFNYDGVYIDKRSDEDYLDWTRQWIGCCADLLKPSGSFYILIGDEYAAETRVFLKDLEREGKLAFRNWIIWHYTFGQRCKVKYNRSHAHLFYCVGSAAINAKEITTNLPFTFNYDAVALPSARMTTYGDRRANPSGKLPDDTWYLRNFPSAAEWFTRPQEASQADPDHFASDSDTWFQSRLCGTFGEREQWHPCQLPEALLERILRASSNPGDLVFDPFTGSGTTLAVAKRLGRDWLGCELSPQYRKKAMARIKDVPVDAPAPQAAAEPPKPRPNAEANPKPHKADTLF